jgi:hypothetical protein
LIKGKQAATTNKPNAIEAEIDSQYLVRRGITGEAQTSCLTTDVVQIYFVACASLISPLPAR